MSKSKEKAAREAAEAKKKAAEAAAEPKVEAGNASLYADCGVQLMFLSWEEDGDEAKKDAIVSSIKKEIKKDKGRPEPSGIFRKLAEGEYEDLRSLYKDLWPRATYPLDVKPKPVADLTVSEFEPDEPPKITAPSASLKPERTPEPVKSKPVLAKAATSKMDGPLSSQQRLIIDSVEDIDSIRIDIGSDGKAVLRVLFVHTAKGSKIVSPAEAKKMVEDPLCSARGEDFSYCRVNATFWNSGSKITPIRDDEIPAFRKKEVFEMI